MFTEALVDRFTSDSADIGIGSCVVSIKRDSDDELRWSYNSDEHMMFFERSCSFIIHALDASPDPQSPTVNFDVQGTTTSAMPQLWRGWLRDCLHNHRLCGSEVKQSAFNPRRLVEIQAGSTCAQFKWKVVETAGHRPLAYLTLSHCWGKSEHMKLTRTTYDVLQQESDCSILPKTYRDAVQVTSELGYRYLWIDSLCIIQGDPDDWKEQSVLMGSIYYNADCNIAAMVAEDGTKGCFGTRDPAVLSATLLSWKQDHEDAKSYAISSVMRLPGSSWNTPLTRRAWVTQERYLARRQLCFLGNQVYWECTELVASEQEPNGLLRPQYWVQSSGSPGKPGLDFRSRASVRDTWSDLVARYSSCKLTHASDKAIAISGLVSHIQTQTSDEYLCGLWKHDILNQLSWRVSTKKACMSRKRHAVYGCPSWSWISLGAEIRMHPHYDYEDRRYLFVSECLDVTIRSEDSARLYGFLGSTITLRGLGAFVKIFEIPLPGGLETCPAHCVAEVQVDAKGSVPFSLGDNNRLCVYWDNYQGVDGESNERPCEMWGSNFLILFVTICYAGSGCLGPKKPESDNVAERSAAVTEISESDSNPEWSTIGSGASSDSYADRADAGADWIEGLVLWRPDGRDGKEPFLRVGVAFAGMQTIASVGRQSLHGDGSLISLVEERLGLEPGTPPTNGFNLADERLSDLIFTVTII